MKEQYKPSSEEINKAKEMMTPEQKESSQERVKEMIKNREINVEKMKEVLERQEHAEKVTLEVIGFLPNDVASKGLRRTLQNMEEELQEARKNLEQ